MTDPDADRFRTGALAGAGAYALWGMFPLVFHQLRDVPALEIVGHRIVWSFLVVVVLQAWFARRRRPEPLTRNQLLSLTVASLLIAVNWLVYIWAVNSARVVEAALGYYINPLISVALGIAVFGEQLRRLQVVALAMGAVAVAVLTVALGRPPWAALALALSFAAYGAVKKQAGVGAVRSLRAETTVLVVPALVLLAVTTARGDGSLFNGSAGRDVLLISLGMVTAVPLLLFAVAAERIPLVLVGLLQYLTPSMQLTIGVLVLDEALPPERLVGFVVIWLALAVLAVDSFRAAGRLRAASTSRAGSGAPDEQALVEPPV